MRTNIAWTTVAIGVATGVIGESAVAIYEATEATEATELAVELSRFYRRSEKAIQSGNLGKSGEAAAQEIAGVLKNTETWNVNGRDRIPDLVMAQDRATRLPTQIGEVKNVPYQSYTKQLKDDVALVGKNGKVDVYLPKEAKVSKPLQRAFDDPTNPLNRVDLPPPK